MLVLLIVAWYGWGEVREPLEARAFISQNVSFITN